MVDIIRLLPDSLANQIAAGEVVQRPASVVKELLENSIDAGSTRIQLIVKDAGKQLIQVIDNGKGMSDRDARMCFERHATSKLATTEDLFNIRTLGFRGEALASIAAVAQVELRTRRDGDELGVSLKIEGSEFKGSESISCNKGTSIAVKNLFFNVPARRNFLKSNPVEMKHILEEFQRVALSFPDITFILVNNDLEVYNLPAEKLSKRIIGVFGNTYKEQLIPCQEDTEVVKIHGYIGKPEHVRKTRGEQFFFVNRRFIKNNYLNHAVNQAFQDLIPEESFPFYVLFIEIDPTHIDINVHPTKTEIKFDDERTIYAIIKATVKKALATHNITPSLDFDQDINFNMFNTGLNTESLKSAGFYTNSGSGFRRPGQEPGEWQKMYEGSERNSENESQLEFAISGERTIQPLIIESAATRQEGFKTEFSGENSSTFQLHSTYIVSQIKSGMVIVDQQAAHERILYEQYLNQLRNKSGASQQFLFPLTLELNPADFALVMELDPEIRALGFIFNIFGKSSIVIEGIPADIQGGNEKNLFEGLLEQFKLNQSELKLEKTENLARSIARRSAMKPGTRLTIMEMNTLIDKLFACRTPNYSPAGNATFVIMDLDKISKLFNR
jgi:DNA mismatch repair protein MutL